MTWIFINTILRTSHLKLFQLCIMREKLRMCLRVNSILQGLHKKSVRIKTLYQSHPVIAGDKEEQGLLIQMTINLCLYSLLTKCWNICCQAMGRNMEELSPNYTMDTGKHWTLYIWKIFHGSYLSTFIL